MTNVTAGSDGALEEQRRWQEQWARFRTEIDVERPLLERWLRPVTLDEVRGLDVLDVGCGNGVHTAILAGAGAKHVTGVDYASWREAEARFAGLGNVAFGFHDIASGPPSGGPFDLVVCVGVLPHVSDPRAGVLNMARALKPGGRLVIWATVREGNAALMVFDVVKKAITRTGGVRTRTAVARALALASRPAQLAAARSGTARSVLPYGSYLANMAALPVARVEQNVYDALNAPRRILFTEAEVTGWMREGGLADATAHVREDQKSRTWIGRRAAD